MANGSGQTATTRLRILRFLAGGQAAVDASGADGRVRLSSEPLGTIVVAEGVFGAMVDEGLICLVGRAASLSEAGRTAYTASKRANAMLGTGGRETTTITVELDDGPRDVALNLAESPLAQLARRRARDGTAFLSEQEVRAGECLRRDYTHGMMMPNVSANWGVAVSAGRRGQRPVGGTELTEAAMDARRRVNAAIDAVGPELAGVLIDVCCFLKGLEIVEMERRWPVRSAKIVLKTALAALARHYAPPNPARSGRIVQWGADGFRPELRTAARTG